MILKRLLNNPIEDKLKKNYFVTWLHRICPSFFIKFVRAKVINGSKALPMLKEFDEARKYGCILLFPEEKGFIVNEAVNFI